MALRSENFLLQRYIEKAMVDLPALPTVIVQVLQATDKETVTTTEVEGLLSTDAAITTKLLKVVNSAYFGLPRQVSGIGQAIAILGMHQVRNLVLSVGVLNALSSPNPRVLDVQKSFWEQSFAAGTCAQVLAKRKGLTGRDVDLAFIGGLLHDVGRLFLFTLFNQPYQQVMTESARLNEPLIETEARILGTTHAELGGVLSEKWNFPMVLSDLIRWHETPDSVTDDEAKAKVYAVHIADRLTAENDANCPAHGEWSPAAMAWLDATPEQLDELRGEIVGYVTKAKELLGIL